MTKHSKTILLMAGMGAAALIVGRGRRRPSRADEKPSLKASFEPIISEPDISIDLFKNTNRSSSVSEGPSGYRDILIKNIDPEGRAQLGMLYQVKPGDTPIGIASEALFGSRSPVTDPFMKRALIDLIIRIDCSPWNQALYALPTEHGVDEWRQGDYFTQRRISFDPIYLDNYRRILDGLQPSAGIGNCCALIWIPMINFEIFDLEGIVTTEGMYHQDMESGPGGSMIDPPEEILSIGFANVSDTMAGCKLPEGDFRRRLIAK